MTFTRRRFLSIPALAFLGALSLFRPSSQALAGHLMMEIQTSLVVREGTLQGKITVTNRGDEPARKVFTELRFPGDTVVKEIADLLGVGQAAHVSFTKILGDIKNGTYALPITLIYHDLRLYPFSALSCPTFTLGESVSPGLSCSATPTESSEEIMFKIENLESFSKRVKCTFLFPLEFYCPRPEISFHIEPLETKTVSFPLLGSTAMPGCRYPVYTVVEFENQNHRLSLVCAGKIRFMEQGNWFKRTRWYWLAGWLLLMALGIPVTKRMSRAFL